MIFASCEPSTKGTNISLFHLLAFKVTYAHIPVQICIDTTTTSSSSIYTHGQIHMPCLHTLLPKHAGGHALGPY